MVSLPDSIRSRLLAKLAAISPPGSGWKTLVVDPFARALLDHVLSSDNDVLNLNVTVIDPLQSARRPDPSLPAIYLLLPTTQSVHRLLADFAPPSPGYAGAHIIFLDGCPDHLISLLTTGIPSLKLKSIEDLFLHFWPRERAVFLSRQPWAAYTLYGARGSQLNAEMARDNLEDDLAVMSRTVTNLLVHLSEDPVVRFYKPQHHGPLGPLGDAQQPAGGAGSTAAPPGGGGGGGGERWRSALSARSTALGSGASSSSRATDVPQGDGVSKRLAELVAREVAALKRTDGGLFSPKPTDPPSPTRPRATLFIVDRSLDPVAPFPHEFTYQAMVSDLLTLEDDGLAYTYETTSPQSPRPELKRATLTESDTVWTEVRHLHMRDAIDWLMAEFNGFLKANGGFSARAGAVTLNDMKDLLASLPQFQDLREKFSLHLSMAQRSMDLFESKRLADSGMVEQNCATGTTAEGKTPKTLVEDMIPLLGESEAVVTRLDKVRIVALYIMYKDGVPDEDRRRLFQHAKLSVAEQDAVNNLVLLGQRVVKNPGERESKRMRMKQRASAAEDEYELSRFKPALRTMLEEHVGGRLDPALFPALADPSSADPAAAGGGGSSSSSKSNGGQQAVPASFRSSPAPGSSSPAPSASGSLRSQRPNWHRAGPSTTGGATNGGAGGSSSSVGGGGGGTGSSLRSKGGSGASAARDASRQRLIVFVAGGITYSEMRSAYQVGQALGKEVIIGSTHIITPESFIKDLKSLGKPGIGARPPNLYPLDPSFPLDQTQPPRTDAERYQLVLDKMHWTTFVPPSLPPPPAVAPGGGGKGSSKSADRDVRMASPAPAGPTAPPPPAKEKKKKGLFSRF